MTYLEMMKAGDENDIAGVLCDLMNEASDLLDKKEHFFTSACAFCPAIDQCERRRNGFHAWLQKEVE